MYLSDIKIGNVVHSINGKEFIVQHIRKTFDGEKETITLSSIDNEFFYSVYLKTGICLFSGMSDLGYDIKLINDTDPLLFEEAVYVYDFVYNPFSLIGESNPYLFSKDELSMLYTSGCFPIGDYRILTQDRSTQLICGDNNSEGDIFVLANTDNVCSSACICPPSLSTL